MVAQKSDSTDDFMDDYLSRGESTSLSDSTSSTCHNKGKDLFIQSGLYEDIDSDTAHQLPSFRASDTAGSHESKHPSFTNDNVSCSSTVPNASVPPPRGAQTRQEPMAQLDGQTDDREKIPKKRKASMQTSSNLNADLQVRRSERGAGFQPEYGGLGEKHGFVPTRMPAVLGTKPSRGLVLNYRFAGPGNAVGELANPHDNHYVETPTSSATPDDAPRAMSARPIATMKGRTIRGESSNRIMGIHSNTSPIASLTGRITRSRIASLHNVSEAKSPATSPSPATSSPLAPSPFPAEPPNLQASEDSTAEPSSTLFPDPNIVVARARKQPHRSHAAQARNRVRAQINGFNNRSVEIDEQLPRQPNTETPPKAKTQSKAKVKVKASPTPLSEYKWDLPVKTKLGSLAKKREWKEERKQVLADIKAGEFHAHSPAKVEAQKLMYEKRVERSMEHWPESNVRGAKDDDNPERHVKIKMAEALRIVSEQNRVEEEEEEKEKARQASERAQADRDATLSPLGESQQDDNNNSHIQPDIVRSSHENLVLHQASADADTDQTLSNRLFRPSSSSTDRSLAFNIDQLPGEITQPLSSANARPPASTTNLPPSITDRAAQDAAHAADFPNANFQHQDAGVSEWVRNFAAMIRSADERKGSVTIGPISGREYRAHEDNELLEELETAEELAAWDDLRAAEERAQAEKRRRVTEKLAKIDCLRSVALMALKHYGTGIGDTKTQRKHLIADETKTQYNKRITSLMTERLGLKLESPPLAGENFPPLTPRYLRPLTVVRPMATIAEETAMNDGVQGGRGIGPFGEGSSGHSQNVRRCATHFYHPK